MKPNPEWVKWREEAKVNYLNFNESRATGRTTRTLWRALLAASEMKPPMKLVVVVLVDTYNVADWTYGYLCRLVGPLSHMMFDRARRSVAFPTGAEIMVKAYTSVPDWSMWTAGRSPDSYVVFEDHY